jgi:hypothetical protein
MGSPNKTEFENRQQKPTATLSSQFFLNNSRAPKRPSKKPVIAPKEKLPSKFN